MNNYAGNLTLYSKYSSDRSVRVGPSKRQSLFVTFSFSFIVVRSPFHIAKYALKITENVRIRLKVIRIFFDIIICYTVWLLYMCTAEYVSTCPHFRYISSCDDISLWWNQLQGNGKLLIAYVV